VATPDDTIDCQGGKITIFGRTIHDNQGEHFGVIPVHKALEESSDVAAVKLAMKIGSGKFYQYIRDFGFGARSGVELPGETRGLLRPVSRWQASSIGSVAIGQEIAVTPVLMPEQSGSATLNQKAAPPQVAAPQAPQPQLTAAPVKLGEDLPDPLPSGAHRVISTLASAEMRKMMEGVVLFGTGKQAQLNGYSSGGKTGTAQKIDPVTHTYSKTMHIGSFAGFAPVNSPVIAVAVILDSPKGAYYGADVAAPVFADVAQQVLEYLGVPHDIDLRPTTSAGKKQPPVAEDDAAAQGENIQALYDAANDLPSDDPLHPAANAPAAPAANAPAAQTAQAAPAPASNVAASPSSGSLPGNGATQTAQPPAQETQPAPHPAGDKVVINDGGELTVPLLLGMSVRQVIEAAGSAGLEVEITGSGTAREQAPAAGTKVPPGTKIVVRCER
jgi:cell division protein FtsI (penicillin-binding protein 3)